MRWSSPDEIFNRIRFILQNMLREFWPYRVSEQAIRRRKKDVYIIKCAASPSGGKHIGNLNEIVRSWFIKRAMEDLGYKARIIHTSDDRDPIRKIPRKLPNKNGEWFESKDVIENPEEYIGRPYSQAPDPFGCHKSWSEHFTEVWLNGARMLGIKDFENYYTEDMYREGMFRKPIEIIVRKIEKAREIMRKFQNIPEDYYPFWVVCEQCGRVTGKVIEIDLENWTVNYECVDRVLGEGNYVKGCGYKGETSLDNVKISWRFEWPAQWYIWGVDIEPFGKDHAIGSWPSGKLIAREIFEIDPPVPHIYEFFTVNGEKMSASKGNVYIVQDILKFSEPEPFLFFYTKRPTAQRDIDLKNYFMLVDEYDRAEGIYFGVERLEDKKKEEALKTQYWFSTPNIPKRYPRKIDYKNAAIIGQVAKDRDDILRILRKFLPIDEMEDWEIELNINRVLKASYWARNYADEKFRIEIVWKKIELSEKEREALEELVKELDKVEEDYEKINYVLFEVAKRTVGWDLFKIVYKIVLGRDSGPRLANLIISIGKEEFVKRITSLLSS